ncbi:EAL domain-containing protein [Ectopseudomonas mendocina]|uniref:EAL domain-containing protein n=1 Tax=Ectopseudomonas mendocina TaxID=300 RepID=A0ABZ2RLQ5_ECTME
MATPFMSGVALWYLPFALGVLLVIWWGPRVLPAAYLSGILSCVYNGLSWQTAALCALPMTTALGLAWLLLYLRLFDPTVPSVRHLVRYMLWGVLLPATTLCFGGMLVSWAQYGLQLAQLPTASLTLWLMSCLVAFGGGTILLVYLTPWLKKRGWLINGPVSSAEPLQENLSKLPPGLLLLALLIAMPWMLANTYLELNLPLFGMMLFALALKWGFPGALCGAALSALMVISLPFLREWVGFAPWADAQRMNLHLGVLLFTLASLLLGRSLSDLRQSLARSSRMQEQLSLAHLALDASPLGVVIVDVRQPHMPLIYCNPAFERMSGYSNAETIGKSWDFLVREDRQQEGFMRLRQAIEDGIACDVVLRLYRKDLQSMWAQLTLSPIYDDVGISHFVVMQSDVTAREQLASQVRAQSDELLKQSYLFSQTENIADLGGWVLNLPSGTMDWSAGCFRIYELDPGQGTPQLTGALSYMDTSSRELTEAKLAELVSGRGQDHFDFEVRILTAKGKSRWLRLRGITEWDENELVRIYGAIQDISARKFAEQQLRERDERLNLFFEAPLIGMAMTSPSFAWEEVNQRFCSMLGRSHDDLMTCTWASLSVEEELVIERSLLDQVHGGEREGFELEKRFRRADGSLVHTRVSLRAVRHSTGRVRMFLLLVEDISGRLQAEARYRTLVENAPEAIMLVDVQGRMVDCNENTLRLLRYTREAITTKTLFDLSPAKQANGRPSQEYGRLQLEQAIAGGAPVFEWLHRDSSGRNIPCEVRLVRMPGEPVLIRGSVMDISERQHYQQEIERLAYSDELTGLPNRRLLLDRLQHAMQRELREGTTGALLFIDLDHFKTVNDSLGHQVGDGLLREVTLRLVSALRAQDTLARMGGDEFVVLLEGLDKDPEVAAESAAITAKKLLKALVDRSCWIDGHELSISASIGIALHPLGRQAASDVLKQADTAMYQAKQGGRNAFHFFAPEMQAVIDQRLQMQNELRLAVQRGQLRLMFQPQLELHSNRVSGAEVLLRWGHPERGEVMPGDFIPLAEETGLIEELGTWVLEQACAQLNKWLVMRPDFVLAINLSPRELRQRNCVSRVRDCLQRHNIAPQSLELEITEGVLVEDVEQCISNMQALKTLGVRFSIDDFGTGYSSLTYLKRLPLDRLKIDRSFIWDMDAADGNGLMIVQTILVIARNLGLECVAEGIESQEQLACLREQGCELGQGYYFSRPLSEEEFTQWLVQAHTEPAT